MKKLVISLFLFGGEAMASCDHYSDLYMTRPNPNHLTIFYPDREMLFDSLFLSVRKSKSIPTTETFFVKNIQICRKGNLDVEFPAAVAVGKKNGRMMRYTLTEEEVEQILLSNAIYRFKDSF